MRKFSCAAAPLTLFIHKAFSASSEKEKLYNKYILNMKNYESFLNKFNNLYNNDIRLVDLKDK